MDITEPNQPATVFIYECPRCYKCSESSVNYARIKCGDCLVEHVEIVEMVLVDERPVS